MHLLANTLEGFVASKFNLTLLQSVLDTPVAMLYSGIMVTMVTV